MSRRKKVIIIYPGRNTMCEDGQPFDLFDQIADTLNNAKVTAHIHQRMMPEPTAALHATALLDQLRKAYRELVRVGYDPKHENMKAIRKTINLAKGKA